MTCRTRIAFCIFLTWTLAPLSAHPSAPSDAPDVVDELLLYPPVDPRDSGAPIRDRADAGQPDAEAPSPGIAPLEALIARVAEVWGEAVGEHLKRNNASISDELVRDALAARDDEGGYVANEEKLIRLAELEWAQAEPVLSSFATETMPRRAALATSLLFRHSTSDSRLLEKLKSIVEDRSAPGYSRDTAAAALFSVEWPGLDRWYLGLFADPTLRNLFDGNTLRSPLADRVARDPERWIPIIAGLVNNPDRATHDNAVACLVQFYLDNARRDALSPLLPWLLDPKWSSARDRLRLIQTVDRLEMRESIPGLIAVLNQNVDESERAYAASSLAHFRDPRAIAQLRRGLPLTKSAHYRQMFIEALIVSGGVTDSESASAVEAYADRTKTPQGAEELERSVSSFPPVPLPVPVSIGQYFAEHAGLSETVARLLLDHASKVESNDPLLARALGDIVHRWPSVAGDRDIARRIRSGTASASSIALALGRRDSFRAHCPADLVPDRVDGGVADGLLALLCGDIGRALELLDGADSNAQRALLAAARLIREPLPLEAIARLYDSANPALARAAGAYLQSEDSPRARQIFISRLAGDGPAILGKRQRDDPGHTSYDSFDHLEKQLVQLVSGEEGNDEVLALLTAGYWGDAGQIVIVRKGNSYRLRFYEDPGRRFERTLAPEEVQKLTAFVAEQKVDDLGPLEQMIADGMQYEYVHIIGRQGRRVFMNNPDLGTPERSPYRRLCDEFRGLVGAGPLTILYPEASAAPGFRILLADGRFDVRAFWKEGSDERIQIRPAPRRVRDDIASANLGSIQIESGVPKSEESVWMRVSGRTLVAAQQPAAFPLSDPLHLVPPEFEQVDTLQQATWPLRISDAVYRLGTWRNKLGFWRFENGKPPHLLAEGPFAAPTLTPDGHWALLAQRSGQSWVEPNLLVRIDLASGRLLPVEIPAADTLLPVGYIAERRRFLAMRQGETSEESARRAAPEYWLVRPETGEAERAVGEIRPLTHAGFRPLQSTAQSGSYWAALPAEDGTNIGVFDAGSLSFSPKARVPGLLFESQHLWVDEAGKTAFIAYRSHLLSVTLP